MNCYLYGGVLFVSKKFLVAYYYATEEDFNKIESFRECSGDSEKVLICQYVRGWIGRNREYYEQLTRLDARLRGLSYQELGKLIASDEPLPSYKQDLSPEDVAIIERNPLRSVELPRNTVKRGLNYLTLGIQNFVFLKVAQAYDRDTAINFVSRIVKEHLSRNWEKLYASQVAAENFDNWN